MQTKKRIIWLIVGCLTVAALVLASCAPALVEEEEEEKPVVEEKKPVVEEKKQVVEEKEVVSGKEGPQYGGMFNACYSGSELWDPGGGGTWVDQLAQYNVFEQLAIADWSRGPTGTGEMQVLENYAPEKYFIPLLAESWEMVSPTEVIFHLRQGIHYHDKPPANGREVVADDVAFSFQRTGRNHVGVNVRFPPNKITAKDKYTVVIELDKPSLEPIRFIVWQEAIYPPEIVDEKDRVDWTRAIGTGPYILADYVSATSATLERNPNYWRYDPLHPENKLPYADRLMSLVIPDDASKLAALRTGKIDRYANVTVDQAKGLAKTHPEMLMQSRPGGGGARLFFRADLEPFSDIRVRRALNMAVDLQTIVEGYYQGVGDILHFPLTPDAEAYTPLEELPEELRELYEYNPEKAKQLLAEAGYPNGFKTSTLVLPWPDFLDTMLMVKKYWEDVGVITELNTPALTAGLGQAHGRKYETVTWRGGGGPERDALLKTLFEPYNNFNQWANIDETGASTWYDPEMVKRQDEIRQTADYDKQTELVKELNLYFMSQVYFLSLPRGVTYMVWQPWLKGYSGEYAMGMHFSGEGMWAYCWVDQDLKEAMTGKR